MSTFKKHINFFVFVIVILILSSSSYANQYGYSIPKVPPIVTPAKFMQIKTEILNSVPKPYEDSKMTKDFKIAYSFLWVWRGCKSYTNDTEYAKFQKSSINSLFQNSFNFPEGYDNGSPRTNFFGHPMFGASSYLYFKAKNYNNRKAIFYTILISTLWEYTVEGMVERPSFNDLVITPLGGILIGKALEYLSTPLLKSKNIINRFFGRLINPFSFLSEV